MATKNRGISSPSNDLSGNQTRRAVKHFKPNKSKRRSRIGDSSSTTEGELRTDDQHSRIVLRAWTTKPTVSMFVLGNVATWTLYFLIGFGVVSLPKPLLYALLAATIEQNAVLLLKLADHIFAPDR